MARGDVGSREPSEAHTLLTRSGKLPRVAAADARWITGSRTGVKNRGQAFHVPVRRPGQDSGAAERFRPGTNPVAARVSWDGPGLP